MQIVAQETAPANTGWAGHSKQGQILRLTAMAMMSDGFAGMGTHDPQFGMCGRVRLRRAREEGRLDEYLHGSHIALPYHGCAENLTNALAPYGIAYTDIPSPMNLLKNMETDRVISAMQRTPVRPPQLVDLDLLTTLSACPDLASPGGGQAVTLIIPED